MLKYLKVDSAGLIAQAFGDGKVNVQRDPRVSMLVLNAPADLEQILT